MSRLKPQYLLFGLLLVLSAAVFAQTKQVKMEPIQATTAHTGAELFHEFCAVCHGADAKGNGPAADALKTRPTDLTIINRQNGSKFPTLHVERIISGEDVVAAHGNRDMPTWDDMFKSISADSTFAEMRVKALVDYLQKIQR